MHFWHMIYDKTIFILSHFFFASIFIDSIPNVPMDSVTMWFSPRDTEKLRETC